jgi:L-iditol 2-dehydrogenase
VKGPHRSTMTAVRVHGPGDLRVERVPLPKPADGDVLVRVRAVGVCTTDRKLAARGTPGEGPRTLGHEIVGEITAVGGGAIPAGLAPGRRVAIAPNVGEGSCRWCLEGATNYCPDFRAFGIHLDGGMAEFVLVPRRAVLAGHLLALPDALSDHDAALIEPLACVVEGLTTSGLRPGESVLVVGSGVMGRLHVAAARALGAGPIVVIDRNAGRLEHARALGADVGILADDADAHARVRAATGGRGVDVAAVTVGDARVISETLDLLATGGRLNVFAGVTGGGRVELDPNPLHYRRLALLGTTGATLPTLARTILLLALGRVRVAGIVSATFPLERAAEAFAAAARSEHGRILLEGTPGGEGP